MHDYIRSITLLLLSLMISTCFTSVSVLAQDATPDVNGGLADTPKFALLPLGDHPDGYFKDIEVSPGQTAELAVAIDNGSTMPLSLRTYKVNALSAINGGYESGEPNDDPIGATAWIDYPTYETDVAPGSQEIVHFRVAVPQDTEPGQYVSGLVVETSDPFPIPGTDVLDQHISYAISVGILVPGKLNRSFELGAPKVTDRYLDVPVSNTGNFLVRPSGDISLMTVDGDPVVSSPIQMGSIYGGLSTHIRVILPEQLVAGDYSVSLSLTDEASGISREVRDAQVTIEEPADPKGISLVAASVRPNAEEIVFANVDIALNNGGQPLPAANVNLDVMRDGEQVDSFPLATNQVLLSGENQFVTRYLPADMWQSGEYTFSIKVSAVDPNGGQETILLDEELDATIVVP